MRSKPASPKSPGERVVQDIRRATRKYYSAEDKIRIALDGLQRLPIAGHTSGAASLYAAKGDGALIAEEALRRIPALYETERHIRGQSPDARHAARQERSKPLIDTMHLWLEDKKRRMFSGSPTLAAINYALSHWRGLTHFLGDGRIDLVNNPVERPMRTMTLQRKNTLFAGRGLGAENWAAIASLIETCKLGGINPYAYLTDVLSRLAGIRDGEPIDDLLPRNRINTNSDGDMFEYNTNAMAV
jgi:transposase